MPDLIVPIRLLKFWIAIPDAEHIILFIRRICPSDFWFFPYLKEVLQATSFDEPDEPGELLSAIQGILRVVDREILDAEFQEWMIRLQKFIDENGEEVE
jgi:hypothetical protein